MPCACTWTTRTRSNVPEFTLQARNVTTAGARTAQRAVLIAEAVDRAFVAQLQEDPSHGAGLLQEEPED